MHFRYLIRELYYRKRRTLTATLGLSIGIALLIIINATSMAYREAARMPLKEIGADITVQRNGDVPEELTGPVFPCSAVTIRKQEVDRIRALKGVQGFGQALLLWVFDPDRFSILLGIDPENPTGPGILRNYVTEGRFLEKGKSEALVEAAFARQFKIRAGDRVPIADKIFPVAGIVDASSAAKIAVANIYLPLTEAQKMAATSKQVQKVSPFAPEDVNILFIRADQKEISGVAAAVKDILGKKSNVSTPDSFLKLLGNLFALSDRFSLTASVIAILVTVLIVFKTMAGNVAERAKEIGILKTVGWSNRNVIFQLLGESVFQCLAGGVLGLVIAFLAAVGLGFMEVHIPIPWEMSPTPHFLPGGGDPVFKTLRLPVQIPWKLASFAVILSMFIGGITGGFLSRHISRIKPSEVLRYE
jgi:ABC-type antimicrobial peptide transport system permease subunit